MGVADAVSGEPVAFVPTRGNEHPKTACWCSRHDKVYVACQGSQQRLAVISGASGTITGWVRTGLSPCALAYNPVLDRIYCANNAEASVMVVDCATDSVVASVGVGPQPVALLRSLDGSSVYCVNRGSH